MGEYYAWVNIDKRENIWPCDFDVGSKYCESMWQGNELLRALKDLLAERWRGDRIAFLGDEFRLSGREDHPFLKALYEEAIFFNILNGCFYNVQIEIYKNVGGLYKAAEEEVRNEIEYYLMLLREGQRDMCFNLYRVNRKDPFRGLFERSGRDFRFVINNTKKLAYEPFKTIVSSAGQCDSTQLDPLPLLCSYGRQAGTGQWLGDIIGVSDTLPDGVALLDRIELE